MKKIITSFSLILIAYSSLAQITINSVDIPIPINAFNLDSFTANAPASPSVGTNQNWNYSSYFGNTPALNEYTPETDPFFTSNGIDVYFAGFKNFNSTLGYNLYSEYDFNSSNVKESGLDIPAQSYSLSYITGNTLDSLIIPSQQYNLTSPKIIMAFPFTANSAWQSSSPRKTNFNLNVTAYALSNAPAEHRYTFVRKDSIVGWGKLSVYTPSGPSVAYDELMNRSEQYAIDSFFLAGSPAPLALLSAFSVSQGQQTNTSYSYNFYRKGSFNYLMRLNYGSDNTFTNVVGAFTNTDNLVVTDIQDIDHNNYSTIVYPNPCHGKNIHVQFVGRNISSATYMLIDMFGRVIEEGIVDIESTSSCNISFNRTQQNGHYLLRIFDEKQHEVLNESINILN